MYTLDDLYVMFAQEPTIEGKVELLRDWSQLRLGYQINWPHIIKVWSSYL
jgi:hypothetical protein